MQTSEQALDRSSSKALVSVILECYRDRGVDVSDRLQRQVAFFGQESLSELRDEDLDTIAEKMRSTYLKERDRLPLLSQSSLRFLREWDMTLKQWTDLIQAADDRDLEEWRGLLPTGAEELMKFRSN